MKAVLAAAAGLILAAGLTMRPGHAQNQTAAQARMADGTALAAMPPPASPGAALFDAQCAMCHAAGRLYPGWVALKQSGLPQPALASQANVNADLVKYVVRNGMGVMPPVTPAHLDDADLAVLAAWLASAK